MKIMSNDKYYDLLKRIRKNKRSSDYWYSIVKDQDIQIINMFCDLRKVTKRVYDYEIFYQELLLNIKHQLF